MSKTALIIVDLQNDYFEGGKWELDGTVAAASNAANLLDAFRAKNLPIIHIRHEFPSDDAPFFVPGSEGAEIHDSVKNRDGETVIIKNQINCFKDTDLKQVLDDLGVEDVIICGAMSHMCVDAATRAASDFGYKCAVAEDACATLELEFKGKTIPADQVHAAYMSALGFGYANVTTTKELLAQIR